jgi:hypothetical protein
MRWSESAGKKASSSFLKTRTKKLLQICVCVAATRAPYEEKFFGSFLQKRTLSSFL